MRISPCSRISLSTRGCWWKPSKASPWFLRPRSNKTPNSFVYVIQDNWLTCTTSKLGVTENGQTQVDGINPGDVVANSSFDKLQDNAKVTIASRQ